MPRSKPNQNERIWAFVARSLKPASDPWAAYAKDSDIGVYLTMLYALNFRIGVNAVALHNPWAIEFWEGGFDLFLPAAHTQSDFPKGVTPQEFNENMGLTPDDPFSPVAADRVPNYNKDPAISEWVERYLVQLRRERELYSDDITKLTERRDSSGRYA